MDVLYAPWRYTYIKSTVEKEPQECIFCIAPKKPEDESLVLYKGRYSYIIMNLYPYNTGHVMVVPYRHIADIADLTIDELTEMMELVKLSMIVIRKVLKPHGFNIGINIGRVAGAGIDKHVHIHVVPRWNGDTNFMPVIAGVKVISQDVRETYKALREALKEVIHVTKD
ncbi:HIT family protein [Pyrodictium delaneyi]|nr:HIT family hydrolase [Pyrodictium delaneyi]